MIERVDQQIEQWITSVLPSINVSLLAPKQANQGITLYLMSLAPAPPPRGPQRPPLQVMLRYLVMAQADAPEESHRILSMLLFSAMANPEFTVDLQPFPVEVWTAFGMIPQPSFTLCKVIRQEQTEPVAPAVRHPLVIKTSPITSLSGILAQPDDAPIAGARVEVPDLNIKTQTDARGRFYFRTVPSDPYPRLLRATVKNRSQDFPIDPDQSTIKTLIFDVQSLLSDRRRSMSPTYLAPDIYIEEVASGSRPIQAVGTSTVGFVGVAPNPTAFINEAVAINNWMEFTRRFVADGNASTPLSHAVYGFFLNGGRRCYVVNVGTDGPIAGGGTSRVGLNVLEEIDEVAIVAAPGYVDAASYDAIIEHCERLQDRVAILDAPQNVTDINSLTQVATPPAPSDKKGRTKADGTSSTDAAAPAGGLRARQSDSGYAAYYFPWIRVRDPLSNNTIVDVAPSGYVAGVWARTDATRGVHKAPANEALRGALDVTYRVTRQEQEILNPAGVNVIRYFTGEGIRIWGARTLAAPSGEFRYLNVRRLFAMIEESIAKSMRWVVFEPNDQTLWKSIRRDTTAFLTQLWRDGALMGATSSQAFFVKCDAETNPPDSIDAGMVVAIIGIAPVKPAEFIVFRISQYAGGTEIE